MRRFGLAVFAVFTLFIARTGWAVDSIANITVVVNSANAYGWTGTSSTTETTADNAAPTSGRMYNMYVGPCTTTNVATSSIFVRVNGSNSALTCIVASGGTECSDISNTVDFNAGDRITFANDVGDVGGAAGCPISVAVSANGNSAGTHNAISTFRLSGCNTVSGTNCTPGRVGGSCVGAPDCSYTGGLVIGFNEIAMPSSGGSFNAIGCTLDTNVSGNNDYTALSVTNGSLSDLAALCDSTRIASDTTCTSNCSLSQGDRWTIRRTTSAGPTTTSQGLWLEFSGIPNFEANGGLNSTSAQYSFTNFFVGTSGFSTISTTVARYPRNATFQNLQVNQSANSGQTVAYTVCTGTTNPPTCTGTRPTCNTTTSASTCSDTTNAVRVNAGDYWQVKIGADTASGTINANWSVEAIDAATGRPLSPILYASAALLSALGAIATILRSVMTT